MTTPADAGVAIRRMRIADDLDGIGAVDEASFTNPWTREMYLWEAEHSDVARVFVAEHAGAGIVGYCAVWVVFDELQVNNLAVLPDWRHKGVARRLLHDVFAAARAEGATCATLEVRASNVPAITLYERLGFVRTAVREAYYTQPVEDAWIYWRHDLDPARLLETPRGQWLSALMAREPMCRALITTLSQEAGMPTDSQGLKEHLLQADPEYRALITQHHELEDRLHQLSARPFLSDTEQVEEVTIKKRKLQLKDRMEDILRRHHDAVLHPAPQH